MQGIPPPTKMNVSTILSELAKTVGADAVREACLAYTNGGAAPKKQKRERKPRGKSAWNVEVDTVRTEMMASYRKAHPSDTQEQVEKAVSYKLAFAEASERRRKNNPEAQAKYEQYKERAAARRAEKKAKKQGSAPAPAPAPSPVAELESAEDEVNSRSPRICPECEDPVPAPRGAKAGGDGSHRACLVNGIKAGKYRNPSEWEQSAKEEGQRRAEISEAETASRVVAQAAKAAEPKKRGRPAKKTEDA